MMGKQMTSYFVLEIHEAKKMLKFITRASICFMAIIFLMIAFTKVTQAQSSSAIRANQGRLGLLTATTSGTYVEIGADIARALDNRSNFRIVPYLSSGAIQNLNDLMTYRDADIALVNADTLMNFKVRNPDDPRIAKLSYLAKVYGSELHLIVSRDSGIRTVSDLADRKVAIGQNGSGTWLTSQLVMRALGVQADITPMPNDVALEALKDGKIDATFFLTGKPSAIFQRIKSDEGLTLIGIPFSQALSGIYKAAEFTPDDYPGLVTDKFVPTISVDVILAVYGRYPVGSNEYKLRSNFVRQLRANMAPLQFPPNHPKWKQFSFSEEVPGWDKAEATMQVLSDTAENTSAGPSIADLMKQGFE